MEHGGACATREPPVRGQTAVPQTVERLPREQRSAMTLLPALGNMSLWVTARGGSLSRAGGTGAYFGSPFLQWLSFAAVPTKHNRPQTHADV